MSSAGGPAGGRGVSAATAVRARVACGGEDWLTHVVWQRQRFIADAGSDGASRGDADSSRRLDELPSDLLPAPRAERWSNQSPRPLRGVALRGFLKETSEPPTLVPDTVLIVAVVLVSEPGFPFATCTSEPPPIDLNSFVMLIESNLASIGFQ